MQILFFINIGINSVSIPNTNSNMSRLLRLVVKVLINKSSEDLSKIKLKKKRTFSYLNCVLSTMYSLFLKLGILLFRIYFIHVGMFQASCLVCYDSPVHNVLKPLYS